MTATDLDLVAKHRYRLTHGEIAVNVTSIANLLDDGRSGAMAGAAVKLAKQGLDYRSEWKAKADTGTRVHSVCEDWLMGRESFVRDEDTGYVDALEKFWLDHEPETIECEVVVLSDTHGYGGRLDLIARLNDDRVGLIDLKSGKSYPVATTLQLAAYRFADGIGVYEDEMLHFLRPVPAVDFCACLYVRDDGTYDLVERPADREAFDMFCHLLAVYQWSKRVNKEAA